MGCSDAYESLVGDLDTRARCDTVSHGDNGSAPLSDLASRFGRDTETEMAGTGERRLRSLATPSFRYWEDLFGEKPDIFACVKRPVPLPIQSS